MPVYDIRISTCQRQFVLQQSVTCEDDLEAITHAHSLMAPGHIADIRQGDRKICEVEAPLSAGRRRTEHNEVPPLDS